MLHQLTENTKLLQKALIVADGKVLLLKRSAESKTRPEKWDLPGGNSEWPKEANVDIKDPHQADLLREIKEETDLDVGSFWQNRKQPLFFTTYFEGQKQVFSVIVIWQIKIPSTLQTRVKISSEHSEFHWVDLAKVLEYDFGFAGEDGGFIRESLRVVFRI